MADLPAAASEGDHDSDMAPPTFASFNDGSDVQDDTAPGTPALAGGHLPYLNVSSSGPTTSAFNVNTSSTASSPTQRSLGRKSSRPLVAGTTRTSSSSRTSSPSATRKGSSISSSSKDKEATTATPKANGTSTPLPPPVPPTPMTPGTAASSTAPAPRIRTTPHLPHAKDVPDAPASLMYWSRAPVYGFLPTRNMRAHTVTLADSVAWVFGGCDDKGCWQDVWCFDTETMQWSHPDMLGDIPPPCRAHTSTLVDRRLFVFAGGQGPLYYNDLYILDTLTHRWTHPVFPENTPIPAPRRAHTAVLYRNRIYVFGGGNGMKALNDVWALDVNVPVERMKWEHIDTHGRKPSARGYHTANLIGNVMVVVGGSDGRECFSDIWCLNLDSRVWSEVNPEKSYRRLSHTSTQVGSYLFILGGHDGTKYTSDLLLFNLVSLQFEPRQTMGKPPSPRGYHVTLLADSRLFVFGGFNGHDVFDDVHVLDLAGAAYLSQVTSFHINVE